MNILTRNVPRQYLRNGNLNLTGEGYSSFSYGLSGMTGGYLPALPLEEGGYLVEDPVTFMLKILVQGDTLIKGNTLIDGNLNVYGDSNLKNTNIDGDINLTGKIYVNGEEFKGGEGEDSSKGSSDVYYLSASNVSGDNFYVRVRIKENPLYYSLVGEVAIYGGNETGVNGITGIYNIDLCRYKNAIGYGNVKDEIYIDKWSHLDYVDIYIPISGTITDYTIGAKFVAHPEDGFITDNQKNLITNIAVVDTYLGDKMKVLNSDNNYLRNLKDIDYNWKDVYQSGYLLYYGTTWKYLSLSEFKYDTGIAELEDIYKDIQEKINGLSYKHYSFDLINSEGNGSPYDDHDDFIVVSVNFDPSNNPGTIYFTYNFRLDLLITDGLGTSILQFAAIPEWGSNNLADGYEVRGSLTGIGPHSKLYTCPYISRGHATAWYENWNFYIPIDSNNWHDGPKSVDVLARCIKYDRNGLDNATYDEKPFNYVTSVDVVSGKIVDSRFEGLDGELTELLSTFNTSGIDLGIIEEINKIQSREISYTTYGLNPVYFYLDDKTIDQYGLIEVDLIHSYGDAHFNFIITNDGQYPLHSGINILNCYASGHLLLYITNLRYMNLAIGYGVDGYDVIGFKFDETFFNYGHPANNPPFTSSNPLKVAIKYRGITVIAPDDKPDLTEVTISALNLVGSFGNFGWNLNPTLSQVLEMIDKAITGDAEGKPLTNYYTKEESDIKYVLKSNIPDFSTFATKEELNNYANQIPSDYITEDELNAKGYLEQLDISHLATKEELIEYLPKGEYLTEIPVGYLKDVDLKGYYNPILNRLNIVESTIGDLELILDRIIGEDDNYMIENLNEIIG